ncbi:tetratricopeptide repeat protein [Paenibacillus sp. MBLB4367]|uniref:tetratricopeptide repeat protein n=1 Tax=Paenibacillus sp. MBLB4367 TaxID=3384767 RepID=UPI0039080CE6
MSGETYIHEAYEAILVNDFERAIACFEQAIRLSPDNGSYYYKLSVTYARSNRLNKAFEFAQRACALEPDNEVFTSHLRHIQARQLIEQAEKYLDFDFEQLYMAVELLKEAARLDPLSFNAYLLLGVAYGSLGDYAEAIQAVKEALRLEPDNESGIRLLSEYERQFIAYMRLRHTK